MDKKVDIVIIEDQQLVLDGLVSMLSETPAYHIVKGINNAEQLLHYLNNASPDLLLLDIHLPGKNGLEAAEIIKKRQPKIKIIFVSAEADERTRARVMAIGCEGLLSKSLNIEDLKKGIDEVITGGKVFVLNKKTDAPHNHVTDPRLAKLTARQLEIVRHICTGKTSKQIGADLGISWQTIESHRKEIFMRLGIQNMAQLVALAHQQHII